MKIKDFVVITVVCFAVIAGIMLASNSRAARYDHSPKQIAADAKLETAVFAGGCFWCVEASFEKAEGVIEAVSGYTGGHVENPTYEQVCSETTGHLEAVKVTYDGNQISYEDVVQVFWRSLNPTDAGGSFYDRGESYTSAIFVANDLQREIAEASKLALDKSGRFDKPIVTPIRDLGEFYPAEEYHQDYYRKNPAHYWGYRRGSGRDAFIIKVWGKEKDYKVKKKPAMNAEPKVKGLAGPREWTDQPVADYQRPSDTKIRELLSSIQYRVTQKSGTEYPFRNDFWDEKRAGIYVDIVSGEPLFSSQDKYKSGTGWPSFIRPLVKENITEKVDYELAYSRTEVRSKHAHSHLGHLFTDGPAPTGMRYCINSAALRFVPAKDLKDEGYGHFTSIFTSSADSK